MKKKIISFMAIGMLCFLCSACNTRPIDHIIESDQTDNAISTDFISAEGNNKADADSNGSTNHEAAEKAENNFAQVEKLSNPIFIESLMMELTDKECIETSDAILRGTIVSSNEYKIKGKSSDYYETVFNFNVSRVFYSKDIKENDIIPISVFNSTHEYNLDFPALIDGHEYIIMVRKPSENSPLREITKYNLKSPFYACIPIIDNYCEVNKIFSGYAESVQKSLFLDGFDEKEKDILLFDDYDFTKSEIMNYFADEIQIKNKFEQIYVMKIQEFEKKLGEEIEVLK
ncbi:MAG: hypothetical protein IK990_10825 [Ruminiclostridium sp.]|nr:hypothetical protein [Ruminiclostridium sp.]